jgi:molecular chaperone DnaK (HSP70)
MTAIIYFPLLMFLLPLRAAAGPTAELVVERDTPAVAQGRLRQDIGIETLGGAFTPLLNRGQRVPCQTTETFSTASDDQGEITVHLFRGIAKLARDATRLGRFTIGGLPRRARGKVQVMITIAVTEERTILISATEGTGHALQIRRDDG